MEPKLLPIGTTEAMADAVELVQTSTRRWPGPARMPFETGSFRLASMSITAMTKRR